MGVGRPLACERARAWVSLGLDGELPRVESALLRAHLGRCADCAGFAGDLEGLTRELREARLERPVSWTTWTRRRRATTPLRVGTAAAAVALAVGLGSAVGSLTSSGRGLGPSLGSPAQQRLLALADQAALALSRSGHGILV